MHWRFLSVRRLLSNCTFILNLSFVSFSFLSVSLVCWSVLIFSVNRGRKIFEILYGLGQTPLASFGLSLGLCGLTMCVAAAVAIHFFTNYFIFKGVQESFGFFSIILICSRIFLFFLWCSLIAIRFYLMNFQ